MDVPRDFTFNFNDEEQRRIARRNALHRTFWNAEYGVDTPEAMDTLLSIAGEFNLTDQQLVDVWVRFPNGRTERTTPPPPHPGRGSGYRRYNSGAPRYTVFWGQRAPTFDEFRAFLRNVQREHEERQAQADLHTSRIKPYQYPTGGVDFNNRELPSGSHFEGFYSEHGCAVGTDPHSQKLVQGRAVIDKLFDLVEHTEKAEAGRERLLEELRALRTNFGGVRRPAEGNNDGTFYTALLVEHAEELRTTNSSLVGHAEELKTTNHSLAQHAERAELSRERLLEELRGLRLELGQLSRPSRSNTDRTFYVACGCLGVLVLMLFFK